MQHASSPISAKRRAKFVLGSAAVILAVAGLIAWGLTRNTSYFLTVSELESRGVTPATEEVRVNGEVIPQTVERSGLRTTFEITDGEERVTVTTDQPLPDAFWTAMAAGSSEVEVIAQGGYAAGVFTASQVYAKCPSKFKAKVQNGA